MQFVPVFIAFFVALAGRVCALDIKLRVGNQSSIPASQFLVFDDNDLTTKCANNCSAGIDAINKCPDDACLCRNDTIPVVLKCQQCYFATLIEENRRMPDPRAGNSVALQQYAAACNNSGTPNVTFALQLPGDWDGPYGQFLNTGATVFGVIVALVLGVGAISVVNTM